MIYPHRIRLRGPWECEPLASPGGGPLPGRRRMTMPGRWGELGLPSFAGTVRFIRKFGYPGRIDEDERVWLTCEGFDGTAAIVLNEQSVAKDHVGPFAFDVHALLKQHNRLEITITADSDRGGLWGEVALEVRCTAYLHELQTRRLEDGAVEVTGVVAGTYNRTLELYGLADGAHAHYQLVNPRPEGTPFRFVVPPRETAVQQVRVELVNVSAVWYAWERNLTT
jgi:hypothetical protein